jgi:hypothetical protein
MNAFRKPRRRKQYSDLIAELDPLNDAFREHVLWGESDGERGGHHFSSLRIGKTVFPERWSNEDIFEAIRLVLTAPQHKNDLGQAMFISAVVDFVLVEIALKRTKKGLQLDSAYPRWGTGVYRNTAFGRKEITHSRIELEK